MPQVFAVREQRTSLQCDSISQKNKNKPGKADCANAKTKED